MTVSIDNEFLVYEKTAAQLRTALGTGVRVYGSRPFMPDREQFEKMTVVTFESARLIYFWVVWMGGITPEQFSTGMQRNRYPGQVLGYMSRSETPGKPDPNNASARVPFAEGTATGGSATTLTDSSAAFTTDEFANSHELWVTYSDGSVDHRRILSNTSTTPTIRSQQPFDTAISAGVTYKIWLRPTEWIIREQARLVMDNLTTNRSAGQTAVTGNTPGYVIEPAMLYDLGLWIVTFGDVQRDQFEGKSYV